MLSIHTSNPRSAQIWRFSPVRVSQAPSNCLRIVVSDCGIRRSQHQQRATSRRSRRPQSLRAARRCCAPPASAAAAAAAPASAAMPARVLVSNDDGIDAPGLRALVLELSKLPAVEVYVCAPSEERSAQSHAVSLARFLACHPHKDVDGATAAYSVDGTPADSVSLAIHGPVFGGGGFDLVVSGINRGDNCGLHVIYSGTVGAAREAACKGVPAIALSLDDYNARQVKDYGPSAAISAALVKALLSVLGESPSALADMSEGVVLNANFPAGPVSGMCGVKLTHQGTGCFFPNYREVEEGAGPHMPQIEERTEETRMFRSFAGGYRKDGTEGSDMDGVAAGWTSVTPLGLRSDLLFKSRTGSINSGESALQERHARGSVAVAAQVVARAAAALGVSAAGVEGIEWPVGDA
ncbi:MAG: survival protein sure-like phosphatase/nucleotidase [Monoraphidium minutum]|nr:MAG: survival protein sure-like phosphatase/nucleotidase [Monoraphidium minutum]